MYALMTQSQPVFDPVVLWFAVAKTQYSDRMKHYRQLNKVYPLPLQFCSQDGQPRMSQTLLILESYGRQMNV